MPSSTRSRRPYTASRGPPRPSWPCPGLPRTSCYRCAARKECRRWRSWISSSIVQLRSPPPPRLLLTSPPSQRAPTLLLHLASEKSLARSDGPAYERIVAALAPPHQLLLAPGTAAGARSRLVPLRLYVRDATGGIPALRWEDLTTVSRPVEASGPDGRPRTLGWALRCLLPGVHFPPDPDGPAEGGTGPPLPPPAARSAAGASYALLIQGQTVQLDWSSDLQTFITR